MGAVVVEELGCAAAHVVAVVAAAAVAAVAADRPCIRFGLELADAGEAPPLERGSPSLLQGGALEAFADSVVVR